MLGPFKWVPFSPWYQTNPLLASPKKEFLHRRVTMDFSWLLPPLHNINGGIPKDNFLGVPHKMQLPMVEDLCSLIRKASRGCSLYSVDVARAYHQLPLDPTDWPLVCFSFNGSFFMNISLPFGLRWAASHCQDMTSLITRELTRQGSTVLNYIDDWGGGSLSFHAGRSFCSPSGSPRSARPSRGHAQSYSSWYLHGLAVPSF